MARKPPPPRGPQLDVAGHLGIAFVNTGAARENNRQQGVGSYQELLTWGQQAGILTASGAERLARRAAEDPAAASAAWAEMREARVALSRLFVAQQLEKDLPARDLHVFNQALAQALPSARLVPADPGLAWGFAGDAEAFERVLWPVFFVTAELLISTGGRPQIRQCAMKGCGLFFLDRSPSHQRRWCEMKTCGNRFKSLRHYYRTGRKERDRKMRGSGYWRTRRPRKRKDEQPEPKRRGNVT